MAIWSASTTSSSILARATTPVTPVLAFAIPVSTLQEVAEELIKTGKVSRGYIAQAAKTSPRKWPKPSICRFQQRHHRQCRDQRVAAQRACKWVIFLTKINDTEIIDVNSMVNVVAQLKPGEAVKLSIQRNGQGLELKTTAGERPVVATAAVRLK